MRKCRASDIIAVIRSSPRMAFHDFRERVRELCEEAAACGSESEASGLARQIQMMHERIEELRGALPR